MLKHASKIIISILSICIPAMFVWIEKVDIKLKTIEKDLYYYKKIYEKSEKDKEAQFMILSKKIDKITRYVYKINEDMRVVKHELKLNGHPR